MATTIQPQTKTSDALRVVLEAQENENAAIAEKHVEILQCVERLEQIGGKQDYKRTILEALKAFEKPVNVSFLALVLADHKLFMEARKQLVEKGSIVELQEGNRKVLKLIQKQAA